MERRLMKDFQIGIVEGIISDAIKSDKGPKDVFSKIAKAIGRRSGSKSSKKGGKDWNEMVRKSQVRRDPIGSTTEARFKQTRRQSARKHIIDHQSHAMSNMDPQKLVEYNPKLSEVTPAARVAYAKFKIKRITEEYETGGGSEGKEESLSAQSSIKVTETNEVSIPQRRLSMDSESQLSHSSTGALDIVHKPSFRPKTPIPEDPREGSVTPETEPPIKPARSPTMKSPKDPAPPVPQATVTTTATVSKQPQVEEPKEKAQPQDTVSSKPKQETKKDDSDSSTSKKPTTGITKPTGKSALTGEVTSGWI